ncbi:MAG: hypothetical protein R3F56_00410 [Planctomycetota bacterium]
MPIHSSTCIARLVRVAPWTLLAVGVVAQVAEPPVPEGKVAALQRILASTTRAAFRFATELRSDSQFVRATQGGKAKPVRTTGAQEAGCLYVVLPDDAGEVLRAGRRSLARIKKGKWVRRFDLDAEGAPLPFLFEPEIFFPAVLDTDLEYLRAEVGTLDDRPVEILTAHAEGEHARALTWSGALPAGEQAMMGVFRIGGGRVVRPKAEQEVDLAFFVDPASKRLLKIAMQLYSKAPGGAAGVFVAVGGAAQEEEPEEPEVDEKAPLRFEHGLPVRSRRIADGWLKVTFEVTFTEHDVARIDALDGAASAALGLGAK